mgnify:CR=1 FL=1
MNTSGALHFPGDSRLKPTARVYGHEEPAADPAVQASDSMAVSPGVKKRAVVPVGLLMRPFAAVADGIASVFAMIWRAIMRFLQRIAGRYGVALDAPGQIAPARMGDSAAFIGENAAAAAQDASEGIRAASEMASQLAQDTPNFRQALQGDGAGAYLKLALARLGSEMKSAQGLRDQQRAQLQAQIEPVAVRLGVHSDELTAMLSRDRLDDATLGMDAALPALRQQALQAQATGERLEGLRAQFVDYCAAALEMEPVAQQSQGLPDLVRAALAEADDPTLSEAVELLLAQSRQDRRPPADSSLAAEAVEAMVQQPTPQPVVEASANRAQPARRRRFGDVDVGQTDVLAPADGDNPAPATLPPVPLADSASVDFELVDLQARSALIRERTS